MNLLLDPTALLSLLEESGPFTHCWPGYRPRKEQRSMVFDLIEAVNQNKIALIEAETGLGKSLAYLLPAVILSYVHKKRIVISTKTIQLQEQILRQELPKMAHALEIEIKPVVMKGMNNYLCPKKVEETLEEALLLSESEREELENILLSPLSKKTRQEHSFSPTLKEKIFAESDHCTHNRCPHFEKCPFFTARKEAQESSFLIVNHSLFFTDLRIQHEKGSERKESPLKNIDLCLFDEAHHLEAAAMDHLAKKCSLLSIIKNLNRLSSQRNGGKIFHLRQKIPRAKRDAFEEKMEMTLPLLEKAVFTAIEDLFSLFTGEKELRKTAIDPSFIQSPFYQTTFVPKVEDLKNALHGLTATLQEFVKLVKALNEEKLQSLLCDIDQIEGKLKLAADFLGSFLSLPLSIEKARWIEMTEISGRFDLQFVEASLDLSPFLKRELFDKHPALVMTSATLRSGADFEALKKRIGLHGNKRLIEKKYPSPFDYKNNVLFMVPKSMPLPEEPSFSSAAIAYIQKLIEATKGGTLVLFTAREMMEHFFEELSPYFNKRKFPHFRQGERAKARIIEEFEKSKNSVLFGTDTFWEGVDIRKKSLRSVILVKLPFKTPSEPLTRAIHEYIKAQNKSPFMEISLPDAVVKFKQGFGRLMRHPSDRGIITCLDKRIFTKAYGSRFIEAMPPCPKLFLENEALEDEVARFFEKDNQCDQLAFGSTQYIQPF